MKQMPIPILTTKLYIPPFQSKTIPRPHLIKKLNDGQQAKFILISASAGFGKTTIVSEWVSGLNRPVMWLSLDEEHSDPLVFLTYFVCGINRVYKDIGLELLMELQSPDPPETDISLSKIINEIALITEDFIFILDDYHVVDSKEIDNIINYLLKNMPNKMHLTIVSREDPNLQLAKLRATGKMIELRASDLRFTALETTDFLNKVMKLNLIQSDISILESKTEGWITGLQLAAISIEGKDNSSNFIETFGASHNFVLDYLIEEVLNLQNDEVLTFLLQTSILDRMCGSLCDGIILNHTTSGQDMLEKLEQLNMFIIPLDNEREWYRYHHLFAELLKHRLIKSKIVSNELHIRASLWYEENGFYIESFKQSTIAGDIDRTIYLLEGNGIPRHDQRTVKLIIDWLQSLPTKVKDEKPLLWITYASALIGIGIITGIEEKLQAAEQAIGDIITDDVKDLIGRIASLRAILAVTTYDDETIYIQSLKALKYLHPKNMSSRTVSNWTLAQSYEIKCDYRNAEKSYNTAISIGNTSGNYLFAILSEAGLGFIQEMENRLHKAAETYNNVLKQVGKQPLPVLCDVYLGLARIHYLWNNLEKANEYCERGVNLARKFEKVIDRFIIADLFSIRLKIVTGDLDEASIMLKVVKDTVYQDNYTHRIPDLIEMMVELNIKQGDLESALQIAREHNLPISKARVLLAAHKPLEVLEILKNEKHSLNIQILQTVAHYINGDKQTAFDTLQKVFKLAETENFIRIFIDEGKMMYDLLLEAETVGITNSFISKILPLFDIENQTLVESLSKREIEVLNLLSKGLSNREICDKLFLALDTVKGHNRRIYGKLGVKTRTLAISRARELKILK
ncbi:MAG: LuxR C-terminal-related transcriptional regulator [Spirochaetaceae bacterium]